MKDLAGFRFIVYRSLDQCRVAWNQDDDISCYFVDSFAQHMRLMLLLFTSSCFLNC